jgi:hypothetical protein
MQNHEALQAGRGLPDIAAKNGAETAIKSPLDVPEGPKKLAAATLASEAANDQ